MAAQSAAEVVDVNAAGVETRTVPQGFTSLLAFDPSQSIEANVEAMTARLSDVTSGSVTLAVRDTTIDGLEIHENDILGMVDGKLLVFDQDWLELPFAHREHIGCTVDYVAGRNRYMGYLISLGVYSFKGVKVGLDCANGSSWNIAKSVFDALGADTYVINNQPNGLNINNDAGSTHIEGLQKFVVEKGLDVGFAYDGDADRCLCVDEKGNVITGDHILFIYG